MRPTVIVNGVKRFQENRLVTWMLDRVGGLNPLSYAQQCGAGTRSDYDEILMMIGTQVSGACLSKEMRELVQFAEENPSTKLADDPDGFREAFRLGYERAKEDMSEAMSQLRSSDEC